MAEIDTLIILIVLHTYLFNDHKKYTVIDVSLLKNVSLKTN